MSFYPSPLKNCLMQRHLTASDAKFQRPIELGRSPLTGLYYVTSIMHRVNSKTPYNHQVYVLLFYLIYPQYSIMAGKLTWELWNDVLDTGTILLLWELNYNGGVLTVIIA